MAQEQEKPFGPYSEADYAFLAAMSDKVGWKRTPQEEEAARQALQTQHNYLSIIENAKYENLMTAIKEQQGVEVRHVRKYEADNVFALAVDPIRLSLVQGERRTRLIFEPRLDNRFDPHFLYGLFLVDIPKALYGEGRDAPSADLIREASTFTLIDSNRRINELSMEVPYQKEAFEKAVENPDNILGIKMSCDGLGISHTLIYPNPRVAREYPAQFTFPSMRAITPEAMDVLLGIHKDGYRLAPGNKTFAHAFAGAVNSIREAYRVK